MVKAWSDASKGKARLGEAEFTAFFKKVQERGAGRGNWEDTRPEYYQKNYALANRVNPKQDGVSMDEFMAMTGVVVGKLFECRARDGQDGSADAKVENAFESAANGEEGPQIPADLLPELQAWGEEGYNRWKAESTPEQKECGAADLKKFQEDPAHGAAEHEAMIQAWQDASGGEARIKEDKFTAFFKKVQERGAGRGNWEDTRPEYYEKNYALANRVNP